MVRTKTVSLAVMVVALMATLALAVGCAGGSGSGSAASSSAAAASSSAAASSTAAASSSAATQTIASSAAAATSYATLEDYINAHQSEWADVVKQIKESGGDVLDVEMSVKGNQISQIMTYKQQYNADQVAQMKASFEDQKASLEDSIAPQIKSIEQGSGVSGVTWYFAYLNADGSEIFSFELGGK